MKHFEVETALEKFFEVTLAKFENDVDFAEVLKFSWHDHFDEVDDEGAINLSEDYDFS